MCWNLDPTDELYAKGEPDSFFLCSISNWLLQKVRTPKVFYSKIG